MKELEKSEALTASAPREDLQAESVDARSRSTAFERGLLRRMTRALGDPPVDLVLWDGSVVKCSGAAALSRLRIADRGALFRLISNPDLQFGELYTAGRLEVEGDLVNFLVASFRSYPRNRLAGQRPNAGWLEKWYRPRAPKANTLSRARDNIHQHYDIGNDFYRLWLDRELVYTCAYFTQPEAGLEQAQIAKMDHVCRKVGLRPGEKVVEAGCGWGALALHMARNYGVTVRAYNISKAQLAYARDRAASEGLADRVEFVEGDYREIEGTYDAFVSVGMLEHVGVKHYGELGEVIHRCLGPSGRGLIHSIGRDRPGFMNTWIEKRIFPGANPPSLGEMTRILEPWSFSILDVENIRLHYARTLEHWLRGFEDSVGEVREMFDEEFVRAWRLYLSGSIAAFISGELQLFQVSFSRHGCNQIPWTREHIYVSRADG